MQVQVQVLVRAGKEERHHRRQMGVDVVVAIDAVAPAAGLG